ncbi:MAG: TRAP transporter large permease subunit [Aquisalimonadaceae bacterium]
MSFAVRFGIGLLLTVFAAVFLVFVATPDTNDGHVGLMMLALVVSAILIGFPAAFTMMGMGVLFGLYAFRGDFHILTNLVVQRTYAIVTDDVLVAIPLFIFMGYLVERANLIERLFSSLHLAMARLPGALAVVTLVTCALFATATGIIGAVVAVMGLLALPVMLKAGYDAKLACGVVTAGGCLGILIPPSVMLIVYGATAGVSVVQLYAGAILPGLMLTGLYVAYVIIAAKLKPSLAPPLTMEQRKVPVPAYATRLGWNGDTRALPALIRALKGRRNTNVPLSTLTMYLALATLPLLAYLLLGQLIFQWVVAPTDAAEPAAAGASASAFWIISAALGALLMAAYAWFTVARFEILKMLLGSCFPLAALITAVLGSIVFGLATPTEAAAIGSLGGIALAAAYRRLNFFMMRDSLALTIKTTAMVGWLFIGAGIFSSVFALLGGQALIEGWVFSLDLSPLEFMILAQLIIFVLGWPMDWAQIIVIFIPIFVPLLDHFGINPLFFGLLVAINLQTAFLTPPVAMAAFYLRGVAPPGITLNHIFRGMLPFLAIQILALVLLYTFPAIGLWLPAQLYG